MRNTYCLVTVAFVLMAAVQITNKSWTFAVGNGLFAAFYLARAMSCSTSELKE